MAKSFSKFQEEIRESFSPKGVVFTFGRFNPPTAGHSLLIDTLIHLANTNKFTPVVYVSPTVEPKKNPLSYLKKLKYLKLAYPKYKGIFANAPEIKSPFHAAKTLSDAGFKNVIMVVGSDRVGEFKASIGAYINHPESEKSFDFESFKVVSAGERDPDSDSVGGMSATKMRQLAAENDFGAFLQGTMPGLSERFCRELFNDVRAGMKITK